MVFSTPFTPALTPAFPFSMAGVMNVAAATLAATFVTFPFKLCARFDNLKSSTALANLLRAKGFTEFTVKFFLSKFTEGTFSVNFVFVSLGCQGFVVILFTSTQEYLKYAVFVKQHYYLPAHVTGLQL